MLDPLIEIILDGIGAKKEESGLTLYLKLEDAPALGKLLQKINNENTGEHVLKRKQITK